jgi:ABC-type glycerol-3-phosphate transport system substrate-binding protein
MKTAVMLAAVVGSALALAGCGGGDGGSTAADTSTTETTTTAPTTTTTETTTTTAPAPKVTTIPIRVVNGQPQGGIQRPKIDQGDKVVLVVRTDSGEAVHLHGYNIEKPVVPGKPVRLPFTANIAGRFEVELHPTDALLAVIEVQP